MTGRLFSLDELYSHGHKVIKHVQTYTHTKIKIVLKIIFNNKLNPFHKFVIRKLKSFCNEINILIGQYLAVKFDQTNISSEHTIE